MLEAVDFPVEKGFDNLYFIQSSEDEPTKAAFTIEEMKLIKKLIQAEVENIPLKGLLLKKLSLNSEMDQVPRLIVKARLGKLVDHSKIFLSPALTICKALPMPLGRCSRKPKSSFA